MNFNQNEIKYGLIKKSCREATRLRETQNRYKLITNRHKLCRADAIIRKTMSSVILKSLHLHKHKHPWRR